MWCVMNEITAPRFKFGQAAFGAGITAKTLRNWLQRDQIELFNARSEDDAHFVFSLGDLAILAVVAELVRFGMPVRTAFDEIGEIRRHILMLSTFKNTPLGALAAALMPISLFVTNDGGQWEVQTLHNDREPEPDDGRKFASVLLVRVPLCFAEVLDRVQKFQETTDAARRQFGEKEAAEAERVMAEGRDDTLDRATFPATFTTGDKDNIAK